MIHVVCDACRRIVAEDDADAVTDGRDAGGRRADVCGPCMREAAARVLARLRGPAAELPGPPPVTVQQRARDIGLPESLTMYLTRRRQ